MADSKAPLRTFSFAADSSTSPFAVPCQTYLANQRAEERDYDYVATGTLVFDSSAADRVLLLQRAMADSMPSKWETPGGGCDNEDPTILHGVARELWEEAGLTASKIGPPVGNGYLFASRKGKRICKFNFFVDVVKGEDGTFEVKLDPNEHQSYIWATEEEVSAGKAGDIKLEFTTKKQEAVVLEAFRIRKQLGLK